MTDLYEDRISTAVGNQKALSSQQLDLLADAFASDQDAQQSKFGKELLELTGGKFENNAANRKILAQHMKSMYSSEMMGDDVNDEYDESIEALAKAAGKEVTQRRVASDTVRALVENIEKVGAVKLGGEFYNLDGTSTVTGEMINSLQTIMNSTNQDMQLLQRAYKQLNITPETLSSQIQGETAQDFIWRPGEEPMKFSRGDIVMGVHSDNPTLSTQPRPDGDSKTTQQLVTNSQEMVVKLNSLVEIMNNHSEVQSEVLKVLQDSGLMESPGDTVVNNGGNSTVINNNTIDSDIMGFRDKVVGRLKTMPTK